jgi:hypothetical protein
MVFNEGDDFRATRRPGDDPAQFRSLVRLPAIPPTPDTVVNQYRGENFDAVNNVWFDSAGTADMSTSGVVSATLNGEPAASSDGVDDFGLADGPQDIFTNPNPAVSFVFRSSDKRDVTAWMALSTSSGSRFEITDLDFGDRSNGELFAVLEDDGGNNLFVQTDASFVDSDIHLAVINVTSSSNVDFYVDDMSTPVSSTTLRTGFDNSQFTASEEVAFFAGNDNGNISDHKSLTSSFFEFKSSPYTLSERQDLKARRPEIPDP